jgi:hypothetical protein
MVKYLWNFEYSIASLLPTGLLGIGELKGDLLNWYIACLLSFLGHFALLLVCPPISANLEAIQPSRPSSSSTASRRAGAHEVIHSPHLDTFPT